MKKIFIPYGRQFINKDDYNLVNQSLKNRLITTGEYVKKFEHEIKKFVNAKYALSCSSGTAALHLAIKSINLKKNDIVIIPIINFVAVSNILNEYGLKVFYADVDPINGQLTPDKLLECIKKNKIKNLKVFFTMYLGGSPYNIKKFYNIKKKFNSYMIEDACHALGSKYKINSKVFPIGSCKHSDISIFSFHPLKSITTGEGGALTTNNKNLYYKAQLFRSHGIKRSKYHWSYDVVEYGLNYRLSDINCALGISQLKKIKKFLQKRKSISKHYIKEISKLRSLKISDQFSNLSAWHLFRINIDFNKIKISKKKFFKIFLSKGIILQQHYIPLYKFSIYKNIKRKFPGAESYFQSSVSLPIYYSLTKKNISKIIKTLKNIVDNK